MYNVHNIKGVDYLEAVMSDIEKLKSNLKTRM